MKKLTNIWDVVSDDYKIGLIKWRTKKYGHKYQIQRDDMFNYDKKIEAIQRIVQEIKKYDINEVLK